MEVHISLVGRRNLRSEIYRQLRRAIMDGRLEGGTPIPPSRELARQLDVSRSTVTEAYDRLASEGYVGGRIGAGTFVTFRRKAGSGKAPHRRPPGALRPRTIWESIRLPDTFGAPAPFDFRSGVADTSLFPHQVWRRFMTRELRAAGCMPAAYEHPAGHRGLREAIARHIAVSRSVETSSEDVTITNGTQQALDIMSRIMLGPGDSVAVEDPGYPPPVRLFRSSGLRVVGVPVDREGLVVEALPRNVKLVYVTPSHQYPLGVTMSASRRQALLEWAERRNAAIIEDDYDSEFRFGGRPLEPLHALDAAGRIVYVGSFSKTMLPGLRLGFLVTPPSLRSAVHKAKHVADWHSNSLVQAAMARFIDDGEFARHIRRASGVYEGRHRMITAILDRDFAGRLSIVPATTGLHVAAETPSLSVDEIGSALGRARQKDVFVRDLPYFAVDGPPRIGFVLGYGGIDTDAIEEGLRRLRSCFEE